MEEDLVETSSNATDGENSDESWSPSESENDKESSKGAEEANLGKRKHQDGEDNSNKRKKVEKDSNLNEAPNSGIEKEKDEGKINKRRKISCPLVACKAKIVHLPRHMRNVHKWTKESSQKVLLKYNIRKRKSKDTMVKTKRKDYHTRRRCPIDQCQSIVFRLPAHLQKVHKLKKTMREYIDAMETAVVVPDHKHPMILWKEERMHQTSTMLHNLEQSRTIASESGESSVENEKDSSSDNDNNMAGECSNDTTAENVNTHPIFVKFEQWMLSPDGGKRDEKTVKQHSAQLFGILRAIDDSEDVNSLLDLKLVRHVFLNNYVKKRNYEAGTIKSYLMSLRHFCTFLISDNPGDINFNVDDVASAREKVQMWSSSYRRESSTRKWQKLEEDTVNGLTPSDINKFEKSEAAREAVKIIGKHSDPTEHDDITQTDYTLVRDFLFTQIFTDNANRPGILADMTVADYKRMRVEDGHHVITVMKHKTAYIYGPARIVLTEKLKSWLDIFIQVIRPQITTLASGNVFLSWNARSMKSCQITKAIQSIFKKAGIDLKITSTSYRKAAVTKVHMDCPELSGKLAGLMAHNEATAKKYYLLAEKTKASVEASSKLGKLMRTEEANEECSPGESSTEPTGDLKRNKEEAKNKRSWSDEDLKKVHTIFGQELMENTVTLDIVRYRVETNEELHGMSPRRIYDRLKKDSKKKLHFSGLVCEPPKACETLQHRVNRIENVGQSVSEVAETIDTDEQLSVSIIAPSERNSNFSDGAIGVLHKMFEDMIVEGKRISKVEIEKRCAKSQDGRKLVDKLSSMQILNRIKYERRKKMLAGLVAK